MRLLDKESQLDYLTGTYLHGLNTFLLQHHNGNGASHFDSQSAACWPLTVDKKCSLRSHNKYSTCSSSTSVTVEGILYNKFVLPQVVFLLCVPQVRMLNFRLSLILRPCSVWRIPDLDFGRLFGSVIILTVALTGKESPQATPSSFYPRLDTLRLYVLVSAKTRWCYCRHVRFQECNCLSL